jgi:nitrogen fixation NifU-like protein
VERQAQIDFILDHYENPRHYGPLQGASAVQKGVNTGCGDAVTFYLRIEPDGRISAISFEGEGCTISMAAASMAAEMIAGTTLADVTDMSPSVILELLGSEIANTRPRCALLGLNTAKAAATAARRESHDSDDV